MRRDDICIYVSPTNRARLAALIGSDHNMPSKVVLATAIHLAFDNYGTHKTGAANAWLTKHARFKLPFTPTSASWPNLVERRFAAITVKAHPPRHLRRRRRVMTTSTAPTPSPNPSCGSRLAMRSSKRSAGHWMHRKLLRSGTKR